MNLPNSNNVTILKEKKYTKLLPLAYFYGWRPRGNYDGLPLQSDTQRNFPFELFKFEESVNDVFERTDEILEALEIAIIDLRSKSNDNQHFIFKSPYPPFRDIESTFQDLDDLMEWMVQEGNEWLMVHPRHDEGLVK